ncbi:MAG: hypothetical protein LBP52_09130 [Burkholderiaceae bacterium]|nr:hypothetical protein [Burkholderiaceae bacterium]
MKIAGSVLQVTGFDCAKAGVNTAAAKHTPAMAFCASLCKNLGCEILESADFLTILLQIFILPIADCRLPIADYTSG